MKVYATLIVDRDVKVGVLPQEPGVIHFSRDEKNDEQHENKKFNPL